MYKKFRKRKQWFRHTIFQPYNVCRKTFKNLKESIEKLRNFFNELCMIIINARLRNVLTHSLLSSFHIVSSYRINCFK